MEQQSLVVRCKAKALFASDVVKVKSQSSERAQSMFVTATVPFLMKLIRAIIPVQHVMARYKLSGVVDCTKMTTLIH